MLPAAANFHAGASFWAPSFFLLLLYAQYQHMECDIWHIHVPVMLLNIPWVPGIVNMRIDDAKGEGRK